MKAGSLRFPARRHARDNHARILAAAREQLSRDPDASLDEIAHAAGVVRRTVYGHFPNRRALIAALAAEATQAVAEAFAATSPGADPGVALARMVLALWPAGDRYRMLISLGRRDLGEETIRAALGPGRAEATAILERGQRKGTFATDLPGPVLALAVESLALALLESQASTGWSDPTGEAAATAIVIAAGVVPVSARHYVRTARREGRLYGQARA